MIGDLAVRVEGQRVSRECHGARMDYAEIIDKTGHAAGGLDREAAEHASRRRCRRWPNACRAARHGTSCGNCRPSLFPGSTRRPTLRRSGSTSSWSRWPRARVPTSRPPRGMRGGFFVLGNALSHQAAAHLAASLPQTFDPLMAEAQRRDLELMPVGQFWARVAAHLGIDQAVARRITQGVLETLAEPVAKGQVEDLMAHLDPLLRRGASAAPGGQRMPHGTSESTGTPSSSSFPARTSQIPRSASASAATLRRAVSRASASCRRNCTASATPSGRVVSMATVSSPGDSRRRPSGLPI
jgi:uncharacterized protein (DUF2267 family)